MDSIQLRQIRARPLHPSDGHAYVYQVDATLFLDLSEAGRLDDLAETVDYVQVVNRIVTLIEHERATLLETIATRVADAILLSHQVKTTRVCLTRLSTEKEPSNQFQVSVSLERTSEGFGQVSPASRVAAEESEFSERLGSADPASAFPSGLQGGSTHPSLTYAHNSPYQGARSRHPLPDNHPVYPGSRRDALSKENPPEGGKTGHELSSHASHVVIAMEGGDDRAKESMYVALASMDGFPGSQIVGISPLYSYSSVLGEENRAKLCAVAILQTPVGLQDLQLALRSIESAQLGDLGQKASSHSPLHLSIVEYRGMEKGSDDDFCLSASQALNHIQVLVPWAVLEPDAVLDDSRGGTVTDLSERAPDRGQLSLLSENWILDGLS